MRRRAGSKSLGSIRLFQDTLFFFFELQQIVAKCHCTKLDDNYFLAALGKLLLQLLRPLKCVTTDVAHRDFF